jgi:DNA polymerase V
MRIALVDCNNFYAACEAEFQPQLKGLALVVLSNNDGCVVARSPEAKAAGVKLGEPFFKIQPLIQKQNIQVFSSNYSLYGDMSQRVMAALAEFTPELEIYSIDEAFLDLSGFNLNALADYGQQIRDRVRQWTGITVSIGIAPTKTLAKLANQSAKSSGRGVHNLDQLSADEVDEVLSATNVEDIWGIGRRYGKSLRTHGIETAFQLKEADLNWAKRTYSVAMQHIILELRGQSCISMELFPPSRHSITVSRSFGRNVTELWELQEAIATYVSRAAEKLRLYRLTANVLQIFALTSRFKETYYSNEVTVSLPVATQDTAELLFYAMGSAEAIYRPGHAFKKAGVLLLELQPEAIAQGHLFEHRDTERSKLLMQTLDRLNHQFGARTVQYAAAGFQKSWSMKQERRSPRWTTHWEELLVVKA